MTMLSFQPLPSLAWPVLLHIHFSLLSPFIPRRNREGEDVTSSARHLSPGVSPGSPQACSLLQRLSSSPHPGGVQWTTGALGCDGMDSVYLRKGQMGKEMDLARHSLYVKHSPNLNPTH